MTNRPPPIPPDNRSSMGPSGSPNATVSTDTSRAKDHTQDNADKRGRTGNIKQNTTNQGYQQDR